MGQSGRKCGVGSQRTCSHVFWLLASSLTMTRTKLLGAPYTACSYQNTHQLCDLYMVSRKMETLCKCRYFAFTIIDPSLNECSYTDMVTCGNKIVQSYIFNKKGKQHKQEVCSPSCLSYGFQLNEITVRLKLPMVYPTILLII